MFQNIIIKFLQDLKQARSGVAEKTEILNKYASVLEIDYEFWRISANFKQVWNILTVLRRYF